jgi:hypothetical protein
MSSWLLLGLLGLLLAGCGPTRKLEVTVLVKPKVDFGQKARIEHLRLGQVQAANPADGEAFRAALMGALARKPQYDLVDAAFQQIVSSAGLVGREGIALKGVDEARTVSLEANLFLEASERTEVKQEKLVLTSSTGRGKPAAKPRKIPVYLRKVEGAARVEVVLRVPEGPPIRRNYGPIRQQFSSKIGKGDLPTGGPSQQTLPSMAELKITLLERLAEDILADLSPHEEVLTFPFVNAGDPQGRFLVYYGGYGHAEKVLLGRIEGGSYQNPADRPADKYHLGLAYLGMGEYNLAEIYIDQAAKEGGSSAYQRAKAAVQRILRTRSEVE